MKCTGFRRKKGSASSSFGFSFFHNKYYIICPQSNWTTNLTNLTIYDKIKNKFMVNFILSFEIPSFFYTDIYKYILYEKEFYVHPLPWKKVWYQPEKKIIQWNKEKFTSSISSIYLKLSLTDWHVLF